MQQLSLSLKLSVAATVESLLNELSRGPPTHENLSEISNLVSLSLEEREEGEVGLHPRVLHIFIVAVNFLKVTTQPPETHPSPWLRGTKTARRRKHTGSPEAS